MVLGVCGILYGAKLAFAQTDFKRLIAYTSVSHMGFVVIGIFSFSALALQGVIMQLIAHGLSTGALFILAGILYERTGTRDLEKTGGLWSSVPRMGTAGLILVLASLGLPGLANFIAEFMILAGTFEFFMAHCSFRGIGFNSGSDLCFANHAENFLWQRKRRSIHQRP